MALYYTFCNLKFSGSDSKDMAEIVHVLYDSADASSYSTWTISAISFSSDPENFKLQYKTITKRVGYEISITLGK